MLNTIEHFGMNIFPVFRVASDLLHLSELARQAHVRIVELRAALRHVPAKNEAADSELEVTPAN